MPRSSPTGSLTIAQLENVLNSRRVQLNQLVKDRSRAQQKLDTIERQIARVSGRGMSAGGRVRNSTSLVQTMQNILRSSGKPMPVGDIEAAVLKTGYKTTSLKFRGIVNQTLIKEKQFSSAGRGLYQLKK